MLQVVRARGRRSVDSGRTELSRSGSGSAIESKIVFAHQFHPFNGGYGRAAPEIAGKNADKDKRYKHKKDRNCDNCIDHDDLFARDSAFESDSGEPCKGGHHRDWLFPS